MLFLFSKKKMIFGQRFQITWDQSVTEFTQDIGWYLLGLGVAATTILISWLILYLGDCCLTSCGKKASLVRPWQSFKYGGATSTSKRSYARLGIILTCIVILVGGFWIAFAFAGVSFWNVIFGYGIVTLVTTYAFGSALQSAGAYVLISMTNKIHEDDWLEIVGMPLEGRVTAINILWVELEFIDLQCSEKSLRHMQIPTVYFITNAIRRNFSRENPDTICSTTIPPQTKAVSGLIGQKVYSY